ncbi:MAG: ABC transporter permease [Bacteroidales bacterium]|nr:ABC transporter permease [Bacteroidales bacterium]
MFNIDNWQELLSTVRKNKLRTFLTGFSVAWGIFMLIVLLGAGQGLENGVKFQFEDDAKNSIWLYPGETSKSHEGMKPGRRIQFTNEDFERIGNTVSSVENISARFYIKGSVNINYGSEYGNFSVRCVHPDHKVLENNRMIDGRFLNLTDLEGYRKIAVVGQLVKKELFKDKNPIGEFIKINGISFRVVGVFEDDGGDDEMRMIYLPISTAQRVFNGQNKINQLMFTTSANVEETKIIENNLKATFAKKHHFDPTDEKALYIRNMLENFQQVMMLFLGIRVFVWIIGFGTIIAGIVGVSNIMMITVKERTREFGVRKAIGATPYSIVSMVLLESVVITIVAGYFGLVSGVGLLEFISQNMENSDFFRNPQVDLGVAISATSLLVISGALAGFFPALKAAKIRPIEALRDE